MEKMPAAESQTRPPQPERPDRGRPDKMLTSMGGAVVGVGLGGGFVGAILGGLVGWLAGKHGEQEYDEKNGK